MKIRNTARHLAIATALAASLLATGCSVVQPVISDAAAVVGLKKGGEKTPRSAAVKEACEGNAFKKALSLLGASPECFAAEDAAASTAENWKVVNEAQRKAGESVTPPPKK